MTNEEAKILLDKYNKGLASPAEAALLQYWFIHEASSKETDLDGKELQQIVGNMRKEVIVQTRPRTAQLWKRIGGVAAAVAAITLGTWLYYTSDMSGSSSRGTEGSLVYATDIAPGRNTATLTLADGNTINLSDAKTGVVVDATSLKYNDGSSVLSSRGMAKDLGPTGLGKTNGRGPSKVGMTNGVGMTSVSTPRGGTYQVTLPDGTRVWLNADSKIKFPSQFIGAQRKIILLGEAYFEVTRNKAKPFIVESPGQEVTVLGTHFNINSYADEGSTKTTLLEGSVRVSSLRDGNTNRALRELSAANQSHRDSKNEIASSRSASRNDGQGGGTVLKPGQQSVLTGNKRIIIKQVDTERIIDWKQGDFVFKDEDFETAMRRVARWYDVEIIYQNEKPIKLDPRGWVSRSSNISSVLKMIESTGDVHFKIEGRQVIVTN